MEARIARLESDVGHVRSDIAEMKLDLRGLREKIEDLKDSVASGKIWALTLYIALAAVNLGTLARGFGWI
jgi:hypothetical protein